MTSSVLSGMELVWPSGNGPCRPRLLDSVGALGLLLHFLCSYMGNDTLGRVFGLPEASTSRYLAYAKEALQEALRRIPAAAIMWPTLEKMTELRQLVRDRWPAHPSVHSIWAWADGCKFRIFEPSQPDRQNAYYNGWTHGVYVNSVQLTGSDGCDTAPCRCNCQRPR